MNQRTVSFYSEGTKMEGDLFLPSDLKSAERRPAVVLCHGFTSAPALPKRLSIAEMNAINQDSDEPREAGEVVKQPPPWKL
jgi:poly(3-hydroxybutyrate) depolymerase